MRKLHNKGRKLQSGIALMMSVFLLSGFQNDVSTVYADESVEESQQTEWTYSYVNKEQTFEVPYSGKYKIELYGAAGGSSDIYSQGGEGGQVVVEAALLSGKTLYINTGEMGKKNGKATYNGGGASSNGSASGGGATSVSYRSGTLSIVLKTEDGETDLIAVAGGGGGAASKYGEFRKAYKDSEGAVVSLPSNRYVPYASVPGNGGGIQGENGHIKIYPDNETSKWLDEEFQTMQYASLMKGNGYTDWTLLGGTQISGYAKGSGQNGKNGSGGSGGGYYGGNSGSGTWISGTGGSGYAKEDCISMNFTVGGNNGNGYVKITYLGELTSKITIDLQDGALHNGQKKYTKEVPFGETADLSDFELLENNRFGYFEDVVNEKRIDSASLFVEKTTYNLKLHYICPLTIKVENSDNQMVKIKITQRDDIKKYFVVHQYDTERGWYYANFETAIQENTGELLKSVTPMGRTVTYDIPDSGFYKVELASGKAGTGIDGGRYAGGSGKAASGYITFLKGDKLTIIVGSNGEDARGNVNNDYESNIDIPGYNGWPYTGRRNDVDTADGNQVGGGNGGYSKLTVTNSAKDSQNILHIDGGKALWMTAHEGRDQHKTPTPGTIIYKSPDLVYLTQKEGIQRGYFNLYKLGNLAVEGDILDHIYVKDKSAPNAPDNGNTIGGSATEIEVEWNDNGDNGTEYKYFVESFEKDTDVLLSTSDVQAFEYTSGIKGYYYTVDGNKNGAVDITKATFVENPTATITRPTGTAYVHVAAVDNAGNVSDTHSFELPDIVIKYDLQGGSFKKGLSYPASAKFNVGFTVDAPEREGFTFVGWDITGMDTNTHEIGDTTTNDVSVSQTKATRFRNLRWSAGEVLFKAIWKDTKAPEFGENGSNGIIYRKADGTVYQPGTWTEQSITVTATAKDDVSGIYGFKWNVSITDKWDLSKNSAVYPYPTTRSNKKELSDSKTFTETGKYNGFIFVKDNANIAGDTYIAGTQNEAKISFGVVMIDKTVPEGKITYQVNGTWKESATDYTNSDVVVKVNAKDLHSGLDSKAYSWDNKKTWVSSGEKSFSENVKGTVYVRDAVGNEISFTYQVTGIDKKSPTVTPVNPPKQDPNEPETNYEFEKIGKLAYDWINSDVKLSFNAVDKPNTNPSYAASGVKRMTIYSSNVSFDKQGVLAQTDSNSISYIVNVQGITYYVVRVEDNAGNETIVNVTVKIDKTAPIIPGKDDGTTDSNFEIEDVDINRYGTDEVENKIKDIDALKRSFKFLGTDYNNPSNGIMTDSTDSSGIDLFKVKLINADDASNYKEYEFGYLAGSLIATKETSSLSGKAILSALFANEINTFAEFPNASALNYVITIKDRAGNETIYKNAAGDEIKNFSIKTVIHYAGIADEDAQMLSNASTEFNIKSTDVNNNETTIPYFMTGDFGYVEAWTVGYVPSIKFDFKTIGLEAVKEIRSGSLPYMYNLGIDEETKYVRTISFAKAEKIMVPSCPDVNGIPYASHYGVHEKESLNNRNEFVKLFLTDGTAIRIPPYYSLKKDGNNKKDGTDSYNQEVHIATIYAVKGNGSHKSKSTPYYVIWDSGSSNIHYRITHET